MKAILDLSDSTNHRCKSLYLAARLGLSTPVGFFIKSNEFSLVSLNLLKESLQGRFFTVHAIFADPVVSKLGEFFESFEETKLSSFLYSLKSTGAEGALVLSTGFGSAPKESEMVFFAIKKTEKGELLVEGANGLSKNFYHLGRHDFSFTENAGSVFGLVPKEVRGFVKENKSRIENLISSFGNCIIECGVIKGAPFFLEAKKDLSEISARMISVPLQDIVGIGLSIEDFTLEKKGIVVAERPELSLSKFIPFAQGFIFKEAPLLCHLAIILRENNVPAVVYPDNTNLIGKKILLTKKEPFLKVLD
ncbi:MAG: PEP-utilizing enzyme [archaeon]